MALMMTKLTLALRGAGAGADVARAVAEEVALALEVLA